jgi:photosystem II stability/assembly factor-like uncharacterized protein
VIPHRPVPFGLFFGGVLAIGLAFLTAAPAAAPAEEVSREQQIADLERQIQELSKKLEELKKQGTPPTSKPEDGIPAEWVKALSWRSIGPAAMGGRIGALSISEADPSTYWVGTASGGLLKTTNNGITFEHQFDREATVSVGDVCVAPSNKDIVWVGTGENNPRNSVSYGDGVYKSTDGGKTWQNMGLKKTFQIGRIVVHSKNPDIVYVGALGRLYGPSDERGVFKTTDGGKNWQKVLFVDDKTGVIDMQMNPKDPETLLVATWERQRDGFDSHPGTEMPPVEGYDRYDPIKKWGPGGAIYKTTDGFKTFKKLTKGLPTCELGRIGLDYYRKDPNIVFAIIDCQKIGMGTPPTQIFLGVQGEDGAGAKLTRITDGSPAAKAGLKAGDVIKSVDKKEIKTYNELAELVRSKKDGDKIILQVQRDKETIEITVTLEKRPVDPQGDIPPRFRGALLFGAQGEDGDVGVKLLRVMPDSAADKAGLKADDVIKSVDKKETKTFQQLVDAIRDKKPDDKVTLQVLRDKETKDVAYTVQEPPAGGGGGGTGGPTRLRPYSFMYGGQRPNAQDQQGPNSHEYGGVYKSTDGGESWTRINSLNPRPMYFSQVRVDPSDEKHLYVLGISMYRSKDGGKTFTDDGGNGVHADQHALWIDPKDGRHMIVGCDGGFYQTYDRMDHWDHLNHLAIGQFYHCAVDSHRPYKVYGGLQDNGSWGGPSHSFGGGLINEDWIMVGGGDGFVCRVDPNDPDLVYFESQDGNVGRRNLRTGERGNIRPARGQGGPAYRFNWNTPFILSSANPRIVYVGGNYVFRSLKQGDDLRVISPEITRTKRGSATALAESPRNPDVLWAGTDDGFLWVSRDGGAKWTNITDRVGLPGPRWVATIEPSRFVEGRCYVVFDGHRSDDDEPYVYVTEDFGQSWKSLRGNLPTGSSRCLREDIVNKNLLYVGTEFAAWASIDRGQSWTKINNNLPTVAVHDFAIHPTAGEIVAATHGRSLWVLDVTALRQITADTLKAKATLYQSNTATLWHSEPAKGGSIYGNGSRKFVGTNLPPGAQIVYSLTKKPEKVSLKIVDFAGKTVLDTKGKTEPGMHVLSWNLRRGGGDGGRPGGGRPGGGGPGGGGPGGGFGGGAVVPPGMYRVVLSVDGEEFSQSLKIEADPTSTSSLLAAEEEEKPAKKRWDDDD